MVDKTEVFSSIFGSQTQGLSLFFQNAFRRPKPASLAELNGSASEKDFQLRPPEAEKQEGKRTKNKEKLEQVSSKPRLSHRGENWGDNPPVAGKKRNISDVTFAADKASAVKVKGLHLAQGAVPKKKLKQQVDIKGPVENHAELTNTESRGKHEKRAIQDVSEHQKPRKRWEKSGNDGAHGPIPSQYDKSAESGSERVKTSTKRKKDGSTPDTKSRKKLRNLEDSLEASYEKKLRGTESIPTAIEDRGPASEVQEEVTTKDKGAGTFSGKRKRIEDDGHVAEATTPRSFDAEEKLERTIFVGNLPLAVKMKALMREFSVYGPVESVRLRSVPLLDTKIPRKGAIIKGQINEAVSSQHAYVVFEKTSSANAALAHNMKEFGGNHLRVDAAHVPHQAVKGKSSLQYDPMRSIFVGNIPFDVKDEELYQTFGTGKSPEMDIEAVRVVRDPHTSVSKGIAYVLFKTKAGALSFLSTRRKVTLRNRILRIRRVMASQSVQKGPTPSRHAKRVEDVDDSQSQRKRAKLSASYEGVRATKKGAHEDKQKHKAASGKHYGSRPPKGVASATGTKRKRVENHQRGISRSKKIRRT